MSSNSRTIYSTAHGSVCPNCGWPAHDCHCSSRFAASEPLPTRIVAGELKRACGAGGAVAEGSIEIQGDLRERVRDVLVKKGWTVKGC